MRFLCPPIVFVFIDETALSRDFSISFQFRTYQRDGLLLALDASDGRGLILQQKSGKVCISQSKL